MKRSARPGRVKVTADGEGVVSHAGSELLREMSEFTGLSATWDAAFLGTYKALPIHFRGRVLADMAVAIADGADSISDLAILRDQPQLFGAVASTPTCGCRKPRPPTSGGHPVLVDEAAQAVGSS